MTLFRAGDATPADWMRLTSENPLEEEKTSAAFLHVLHQRNVLKTDEVRSKLVGPDWFAWLTD